MHDINDKHRGEPWSYPPELLLVDLQRDEQNTIGLHEVKNITAKCSFRYLPLIYSI